MTLQETVAHALLHALTLPMAGSVVRKEFVLGTKGQHILFGAGHTVDTLLLDVATLHQRMVAVAQMLTDEVALKLLWEEVVDGFELKTLAVAAFPLCIVVDYQHQK